MRKVLSRNRLSKLFNITPLLRLVLGFKAVVCLTTNDRVMFLDRRLTCSTTFPGYDLRGVVTKLKDAFQDGFGKLTAKPRDIGSCAVLQLAMRFVSSTNFF